VDIQAIEKAYGRYVKIYDAVFGRMFLPRLRHVIEKLVLSPGQSVLEVGVGTGISLPLYPAGVRVVGVDVLDAMLARAKAKLPGINTQSVLLAKMDGRRLAFKDSVFDHSIVAHVVSVADNPHEILKEMQRVTRPGGSIVIINHFRSENPASLALLKALGPLCRKLGWHPDFALEPLIAKSDLHVEKVYKLFPVDLWKIVWTKSSPRN
jgi:phosphatidylethanolamine/phosphatidyl-N-methylethanolamine N-methyltransferase